jgi:phytoene/squalene synthetase
MAYEADRARRLLQAGIPLTRSVPGRSKVAIAGFVAGGLAALRAIAAVRYDVLPGAPKATKPQVARELAAVLLASSRPNRAGVATTEGEAP